MSALRSPWVTVPVAVVALVVVLLAALWLFQRKLIYVPDSRTVAREVTVRTTDGLELGATHVPAAGADTGLTVLVANGNAGNRSDRLPLARALAARGMSVLLFDYRGYGGNAGSPTEEGLAADVRAARAHLVGERRVAPDRLVYFGESLGGAVVTELATEHPPAGLVLRSPFTELADVARVHYPILPVRTLLKDRFPLAEKLATVRVPTVVVYGDADTIVPPRLSREVVRRAGGPTMGVVVPGADHNDAALLTGRELIDAVATLAATIKR